MAPPAFDQPTDDAVDAALLARWRAGDERAATELVRRHAPGLARFAVSLGERADVEYVRILHPASSTMQADVERALEAILARGGRPDFAAVKALAAPETSPVPEVHIPPPDLAVYDRLLAGGAS